MKLALTTLLALLALPSAASAAPDVRTATGAAPAALDAAVAAFRSDVGAGRREIDWDGAPADRLPGSFFAERGAELDTPGFGVEVFEAANPAYAGGLKAYSGRRLFTPVGSNLTDVRFSVPATGREATTGAFGIVLSDVDTAAGAALVFYDTRGRVLLELPVPAGANGLSFIGVRFRDGERVARVRVRSGTAPLEPGNVDGQNDLAAIDDVIFAEPEADLEPPAEPAPSEGAPAETAPAAPLRASLIPLAKRVRAGRQLSVVIGTSAEASATLQLRRGSRALATRRLTAEPGATTVRLRVPANARGRLRLRLSMVDAAGTRTTRTAAVTVR